MANGGYLTQRAVFGPFRGPHPGASFFCTVPPLSCTVLTDTLLCMGLLKRKPKRDRRRSAGRGHLSTANRRLPRTRTSDYRPRSVVLQRTRSPASAPITFYPRRRRRLLRSAVMRRSGVDQRRFHPGLLASRLYRPHFSFHGESVSVARGLVGRQMLDTSTLPRTAAVCVRRQTRREVLFASGRGGKKHHNRTARRNSDSAISCR